MAVSKKNKGMTIIAVIIMIIILGIIGGTVVSLLNVENYSFVNYLDTTQSLFNSSSGVEWGMKQQVSTAAPISFAGGTIDVQVAGNVITSTGVKGAGKRVIQVVFNAAPIQSPTEGC